MKAIKVIYVFWSLLISHSDCVAIQPSTFGGVVDSVGRLTNSIRVSYQKDSNKTATA